MKRINIKTADVESLIGALSQMTEYALFQAEEGGYPPRIQYVHEVLKENDIDYEINEVD